MLFDVSIENAVMILFLVELLLMIAAPLAHVILCILYLTGRIKLAVTVITLICLMAGIALPVLASYIDIVNLPPDVRCATGSVGFAVLGGLIAIIVIPVAAIIFHIIAWYKHKKVKAAF